MCCWLRPEHGTGIFRIWLLYFSTHSRTYTHTHTRTPRPTLKREGGGRGVGGRNELRFAVVRETDSSSHLADASDPITAFRALRMVGIVIVFVIAPLFSQITNLYRRNGCLSGSQLKNQSNSFVRPVISFWTTLSVVVVVVSHVFVVAFRFLFILLPFCDGPYFEFRLEKQM